MKRFILAWATLGLIALACGSTPPVPPTVDVGGMVAQTMAAYTVDAVHTLAAVPSATPQPPTSTDTPAPTATATVITLTPTIEEIAPDPLPAGFTGIILNNGECINFDTGAITPPDAQCDVWLTGAGLFHQMNAAKLSGYVTMTAPSRSHCIGARYEAGDLAVQTDLFMCFMTNENRPGYIVVREYRGGIPFTGIVLDYWVFR
jgi:hypothetical protein